MSNTAQMPQMMLPYQPFLPPPVGQPPAMPSQTPAPSSMQPAMGSAGMMWKPPTASAANGNNNSTAANSYYHHHRANEQQKLNNR